MNILFFFYSERIWKDTEGNLYGDGNFPPEVWERYLNISDHLTCAMRRSQKIMDINSAKNTGHRIDTERVHMILLPDKNISVKTYFSKKINQELHSKLEAAVQDCDAAILRSCDPVMIRLLRKYRKPYLIEVIGCTWDALWNHGIYGKILALPSFLSSRREIKRASWVLYVTNRFLQHRYPTSGKSIGCSDVLIEEKSDDILKKRLKKIEEKQKPFIIGTLAAVDVSYKGQSYVIYALAKLKRSGISDIQYQLVGGGDQRRLIKLAKRLNVSDQIKFLGQVAHDRVFEWLESIDLYIQPSLQEGMPRSVIEAMSMAVPVMGSKIGGIPELIPDHMTFKARGVSEIVRLLRNLDETLLMEEASRNFAASKAFEPKLLDSKRTKFYREFLYSCKEEYGQHEQEVRSR